jgi:hypothetical protein
MFGDFSFQLFDPPLSFFDSLHEKQFRLIHSQITARRYRSQIFREGILPVTRHAFGRTLAKNSHRFNSIKAQLPVRDHLIGVFLPMSEPFFALRRIENFSSARLSQGRYRLEVCGMRGALLIVVRLPARIGERAQLDWSGS